MNALRHGLTGKTVLLPNDNHAEYDRILNCYVRTVNPATEEELRLIQSLVDCGWRLQRLQSIETGILAKGQIEFASKYEDQSPARRAQLIDTETYLKYEKSIRNLHIQEGRLVRRLEKDQAELVRVQILRKREERLAAECAKIIAAQPLVQAVHSNGLEFSTSKTHQPAVPSAHTKTHKHAA